MPPLFVGGHSAIDFLNTWCEPQGLPFEAFTDGATFLEWFVGAGLVDPAAAARLSRRVGRKALDQAALEAREVREWARAWLDRWRQAPRRGYPAELKVLNDLLARTTYRRQVRAQDGAFVSVEEAPLAATADLIGLLAAQLASLVTQEDPALVKRCAGAACTLWFLDRTKAHRRVFCSPTACANRAKVAAFRERQRR